MQSYSKTRWWSRWEVMHLITQQFGDVEAFLRNDEVSSATSGKLMEIVSDVRKKATLQLELAAVIDIGIHFVKATYDLEGDGPLVFTCHDIVERVRIAVRSAYYPNIDAIARNLSGGNHVLQQQYRAYTIGCIQPGITYFHTTFQHSLQVSISAFKGARLFSPAKAYELYKSLFTGCRFFPYFSFSE